MRRGVATLMEGSDVEVVGVAGNGTDLLKLATSEHPDVVMLDVRMADDDGLDVLAMLRKKHPELPVVMVFDLR